MGVQYDFTSIKERILENLSNKTEHQNVMNNSAIINLIEAISEELEDEMMQDEYLTTENNWGLAQNKSSLLTESKVHNYVVPRKRGATGNVRFSTSETFDAVGSSVVDLPKWTQTSTASGVDFTTVEASTLPITDQYVDVLSVQGVHKTYSSFADGSVNESFTIVNDSIDNTYFDLYINGVLWTYVDTLLDYTGDDNVYELRSLSDFSGVKVTFGDGTYGKKLTDGDEITFDYVETLGSDGNVVSNNQVVNVDSTVFDVNGEQVDIYCTNSSSIAGGESEASLEEIRNDSPKFFQSGDRATTNTDYETIINGFSYIKKVSVIGAYEYNLDNGNDLWEYIPTQDNLVNVIALTTTNEGLTTEQATQLTVDIREKNAPTDILTYPEITLIPMRFNMDVAVSTKTLTLNQVKSNIDTLLSENYSIDELGFYDSIYESDYKSLIDDATGVRKHSTYVTLLYQTEFSSPYASSLFLPLFPIINSSSNVYVKLKTEGEESYVLIGKGDEDGFIVGETGYTFTATSRIDSATGAGSIAITEGLDEDFSSYDVRVEYRLEDSDVELDNRTQLLYYNDSNYLNIEYFER